MNRSQFIKSARIGSLITPRTPLLSFTTQDKEVEQLHHANKGGDEAMEVKGYLMSKGLKEAKVALY